MSNVIVAEGDAKLRRSLERSLTENRYRVRSVEDGPEALQEVLSSPPDILVLDIQMPQMDGIEILRRLRGKKSTVPVLALVKAADIGKNAVSAGAGDYVRKPIDVDELLDRVKRVLASRKRPGSNRSVEVEQRPRVAVRLKELHDPDSGRIDLSKVATFLGVSLADLTESLGVKYTTAYKTPAAPNLQERLAPIKRSLEILDQVIGDPIAIRAWLNSQHPDLGVRTPLQVILNGDAGALQNILENAILGLPA